MHLQIPLLGAALSFVASVQSADSNFTSQCASLATSLSLPNTTVWFTSFVPAGTNLTLSDNNATCAWPSQVVNVDFCRVALHVATSDASGISMEAWLPANWTGRFLSTGNGGLSGCIQYEDLAYTVEQGFAAVGENNGHNGTSGGAFYNAPEVITDFAYRSIHTGVLIGKSITSQFYARPHTKSYYLGCSTGGRQGFKSAQTFPDDFDGLVVGAPALAFNNLSSWSGHFFPITGTPESDTFVSTEQWTAVHEDILAQCDGIDGYVDGILEDPMLCNYRPENLICASNATNTSTCLTGVQAATVRQVFAPLYGQDGALVYPRMQPGSELTAMYLYYTGAGFIFTDDWFRYAVYNDPSWDPATLGPKDYAAAAALNLDNIETWEGDLSKVRDRGSKILHYHGLADPIISSENSPRYYDHVSRTMNLPASELDEFYRFFRISGMGHCTGGNGASFIGQDGASVAGYEPEENVLSAMVRWVEEGVAPESVLGTAYVDGVQGGEVAFRRRHCKWPKRNVYKGGNATSEDSWECVL